ncbi:MAG: type I polyketide synthase [Methylovirgula sp.]
MIEQNDIALIGRSCRMPGAPSVADLWKLLVSGTCAVSEIPADRWSLERLKHPRLHERGRTYTWAAGILDDIWGFDPAAFGLSPREAEQMDPQQRLLLELTWEALEDAGIKPSELAGSQTGVYVGASALDYGNLRILDSAAGDAYFATGNALSIIANRISYIFDLHGPSFTVDTACSSALVALHEATKALNSGRIETAIVGGVNILASPFGFIGFSQASMLSSRGLCQAFSAKADGFVRAEGGIVFVLRRRKAIGTNRIHALIVGSEVNSDGRTAGISLPSSHYQAALLKSIYCESKLDANSLAFIEAHGTGTRVGDPVEAAALGEVLGRHRARPLPIGSVKTNIGHLEAGSGLAGVLKASLALENDLLPASLHFDEPNPDIDFSGLNLEVCVQPLPLTRSSKPRLAGVSSFGFGGTNAHVVLADAPVASPRETRCAPNYLMLSAQSHAALAALVDQYESRFETNDAQEAAAIVAAAGHHREGLSRRLVVPFGSPADLTAALRAWRHETPGVSGFASGEMVGRNAPVAFVYSGNGSQFAGMGRGAYAQNRTFKTHFDAISRRFEKLADWSLIETLHADDLATRLKSTAVAQPILFAVQSAATQALLAQGLVPDFVLGHSVGEVAAAEAAGILDLENAVRLIHYRSLHQEISQGRGGMAVVGGSADSVREVLSHLPDLEIAAANSPRAFTVSGSIADLERLAKLSKKHQVAVRRLDLAYPFHSRGMAPVEEPLLRDLAMLAPVDGHIDFISTVSGRLLTGQELGGNYWWRNVREPVRFMDAVCETARLGARIFIEIGPSAILLSHINDSLDASGYETASFCILDRKETKADPFQMAVATALTRGAKVDPCKMFGADPGPSILLPLYPWQRKPYRLPDSIEAPGLVRAQTWHPLIGARYNSDATEWHSTLDTALVPSLANHCIDGTILLAGAAFVEMALAVAREWLGSETATIADLEILQPMPLAADSARDVLCRVIPAIDLLEILSRPRLSPTGWQTHVKAKLIKHSVVSTGKVAIETPSPMISEAPIDGLDLYKIGLGSGLNFGAEYRQLNRAWRNGSHTILVDLISAEPHPAYGLDPARLDSCFHGLILLFKELARGTSHIAYVPTSFGEVQLCSAGKSIAQARIDITRFDEHSILASFLLLDDAGEIIARLRDARYRAMRMTRDAKAAVVPLRQIAKLACVPTAIIKDGSPLAPAIRDAAQALGCLQTEDMFSPDFLLLEGWATSVAFEAAHRIAQGFKSDPGILVSLAQLPTEAQHWFRGVLVALERSGLVKRTGDAWLVEKGVNLPAPDNVLRHFAATYGENSAELLLAAGAGAAIDALADGDLARFARPATNSTIENFDNGSLQVKAAAVQLAKLLEHSANGWPRDRALSVLQIGSGPLTQRILSLLQRMQARLTIFDPDRTRLEWARLSRELSTDVQFVDELKRLSHHAFDLVISIDALRCLGRDSGSWSTVRRMMGKGASFAAIEPLPSLFRDLVFGLDAVQRQMSRFAEGISIKHAAGFVPPLSNADWASHLGLIGLTDVGVDHVTTSAGSCLLLTGSTVKGREQKAGQDSILFVGDGEAHGTEMISAVATLLASSGSHVSIELDGDVTDQKAAPQHLFYIAVAVDPSRSMRSLARHCLRLKKCAQRLGNRKSTLWLVTRGASGFPGDKQDPIASGVWAFSRTLANEHPGLTVRRVDLMQDLPAQQIGERLRDLVVSGTDETEIILGPDGTRVVRFAPVVRDRLSKLPENAALHLQRGNANIDGLHWAVTARRPPGAGELEIAVTATGLNFRDVMLNLGLLPEEILENGFAAASLGLECVGHVIRVGADLKEFQPGDRVVAFAKGAFATHVTVPSRIVAPLPDGLTPEAAATIPVAFLTAYYALVQCARLKRGEWVLIHGGAGGVGLAAVQIAQWRGAHIIATAGTPEKQALLRALGVSHVFDSRSSAFVDGVRDVTGEGVAVVLNSLSGEAMERSITLLRPFGRFIELGKRDYVANTHIGLRPFKGNLSYFGVDLDQLLVHDPLAAKKLFRAVLARFGDGTFSPLPYRSFEANEITDAFRLMQHAGHIGKIIIRSPKPEDVTVAPPADFHIAAERTHLVTGGLGGFGLETARFLAERGARHIVLVGRSGISSKVAEATVAELAANGVDIRVVAMDISDKAAVQRLFAIFGREMPALAGVIHAAMVLEDAVIANLDAEKLDRVLRPKVVGAELLDQMTASMQLDYFVLFSSVSAMIGNPGQGAYVAANGFLEGLARRRRDAGLPALAIGFGAIANVGVFSRSKSAQQTLATRAGIKPMRPRDALVRMEQALARGRVAHPAEPAIVLALMDWAAARAHLPALQSPTYADLARQDNSELPELGPIDISGLLAEGSVEAARKKVVGAIIEEVARVLRLPREDVVRTKPLSEIGLDSLMGVELALALEQRFSLNSAPPHVASGYSITELCDHLIGLATGAASADEMIARGLVDRHLGEDMGLQALEPAAVAQIIGHSLAMKRPLE